MVVDTPLDNIPVAVGIGVRIFFSILREQVVVVDGTVFGEGQEGGDENKGGRWETPSELLSRVESSTL
ncbi:hypothetical protein Ptr902_10241 [Pyrenophora tritici-repentis]|nr:hypothetical protein L13192_09511 [Pyrenophora tritici-repentis]KAI2478628.1 hypothetical protein Ptr902_10241 [Pyrenophora tritici-repentis]